MAVFEDGSRGDMRNGRLRFLFPRSLGLRDALAFFSGDEQAAGLHGCRAVYVSPTIESVSVKDHDQRKRLWTAFLHLNFG
jgi:hypothetical protein